MREKPILFNTEMVGYLKAAEEEVSALTLFDFIDMGVNV